MWISVKKQLNSYSLGSEVAHTFNDMLEELHMSYADYILAVHSTLVGAQFLGGLSLHLIFLIFMLVHDSIRWFKFTLKPPYRIMH